MMALATSSPTRLDAAKAQPGAPPTVVVSASTPHQANDADPSRVIVTVRDRNGRPVPNADIIILASAPTLPLQLEQFSTRMQAVNAGRGVYQASFTSPVEGPILVTAIDLNSLITDSTFVQFLPPARPAESEPTAATRVAPARDDLQNCKNFWNDFDNQTNPSKLLRDKPAGYLQRIQDVQDVLKLVDKRMEHQIRDAKGKNPPTNDEKKKLQDDIKNKKDAFKRLSDVQLEKLKKYFKKGEGIDFDAFQTCIELFDNFKTTPDQKPRKGDVPKGPDAPGAFLRWVKYANIVIELDIAKDDWTKIKHTLLKGFLIVSTVIDKGRPLTDEEIKKIKDDIKNATTPSDIDKKIQEHLKAADLRQLFGMLPSQGNAGVQVALTSKSCEGVDSALLASSLRDMIHLGAEADGSLFSFGIDRLGRTYIAHGTMTSNTLFLIFSGYGLAPGMGPAIQVLRGSSDDGRMWTGELEGGATGTLGGREGFCTWLGNFTVDVGGGCTVTCEVNPRTHDFGQVRLGQSSDQTFMVSNTGNQPLVINTITSSNGAFSIINTALPLTVPPGGSGLVTVRFSCTTQGSYSGTINFSASSACGPVDCGMVAVEGFCAGT
jgi:hypothetical protein